MQQVVASAAEARGAVRHDAFALGGADFATEVGFAGAAELAVAAFGGAGGWGGTRVSRRARRSGVWRGLGGERARGLVLECDDVVAGLDGCDGLADGFDDAGALVAEHDGEGAFGVFAGEGVCVCVLSVHGELCALGNSTVPVWQTPV